MFCAELGMRVFKLNAPFLAIGEDQFCSSPKNESNPNYYIALPIHRIIILRLKILYYMK
jgi:hypothetical protein